MKIDLAQRQISSAAETSTFNVESNIRRIVASWLF